jgi:uncharacterized protein (TIGR02246 family)
MRRTVLLALTLGTCCGAAGCVGRDVDLAAATEAVRARSAGCAAAEAAKDIERALAFWAEDAVLQAPGTPQLQGRDAVREVYRKSLGATKEFSGTTSHITVSRGGDLAFEYGINRMVYPGPQGDLLDMGKYLVVWKNVKDEWYIAALSVTSDAAAPVPIDSKR